MGHVYVLLGEVSVQNFVHVCCPFLDVESYEFFTHFGDQTLVQYVIDKYVLAYSQLPFHFDGGFFSHAEAF